MKLKKILLAGLITSIIPNIVNAETFTDGNNIYDLNERVVPCVENLDYEATLKDGTMIFINPQATKTTEFLVTLKNDNKCYPVTKTDDILKLLNQMEYNVYEIWVDYDKSEESALYHTIDHHYYISDGLKKATTYVSNKEYYKYDAGNDIYDFIGEIDETTFNSGEYYETAYFKRPKSVTLEEGAEYYKEGDKRVFTKITEEEKNAITEENIFNYYILTDQEFVETIKIKDANKNLIKVLKEKQYKRHELITSKTEKEFYIWGYLDDNLESFDVLDEEGNIIFENISWFTTILDELYAVSKDGKTYIYNKNLEIIYTSSKDLILEELGFSNNISSLDGTDNKMYQLTKTTKPEEITKEEPQSEEKKDTTNTTNPKTSDDIITTIIIALITSLGLISLILFQRKQKNN